MADEQTKILPVAVALGILFPNNKWSIEPDNLSTLVWDDAPELRPTD